MNAVQHTDRGGEIVVEASQMNGQAYFDISNTGYIDEKDIPHVFDRLYRGENSRGSRGSGLGLSITKAIAEAHNGSVAMRQNGDKTEVLFSVNAHGPACVR